MKNAGLKPIDIIKEYLLISTIYWYLLRNNYKKMEEGMFYDLSYTPHGAWIHVYDKTKWIEIDFDYIDYDGLNIKYFNLWKVNEFSEKKYWTKINQIDFDDLVSSWDIEKNIEFWYYYLLK